MPSRAASCLRKLVHLLSEAVNDASQLTHHCIVPREKEQSRLRLRQQIYPKSRKGAEDRV